MKQILCLQVMIGNATSPARQRINRENYKLAASGSSNTEFSGISGFAPFVKPGG
jgi:hypothetical protein